MVIEWLQHDHCFYAIILLPSYYYKLVFQIAFSTHLQQYCLNSKSGSGLLMSCRLVHKINFYKNVGPVNNFQIFQSMIVHSSDKNGKAFKKSLII